MWNPRKKEELLARRARARAGGGEERVRKQRAQGKLTARERLEALFDEGSFRELDDLIESRIDDFGMDKKRVPGDGVIVGYGQIDGRLAFAASEDFTVVGGTLGECHSRKICRVMDMALKARAPFLSINDSGGARIEEGVSSLSGYSGIFLRNTRASGVIPQLALVLGPCAGGACYSPAICDFVLMARGHSLMFITGPQVVRAVTREEISSEALGGADVHAKESGVAHFVLDDDAACLAMARKLLSYLPQNRCELPPEREALPVDRSAELEEIVPDNPRRAYDVRRVIEAIADEGSILEIQESFAQNIVVCLARVDGRSVGFVANQPAHRSGALDVDASDKAARFIRFCDCFSIPLVTLVDVPAFLPGSAQERAGIIRHGAKLLYAYAEATVGKITLILRKAYGGAYIAMNSKEMGADVVYAWPIAEIAVMGAEGAVDIVFKREIAGAPDPAKERAERIRQYEERFMNPYAAAERGYVDEVILPGETRARIAAALDMLRGKREPGGAAHGNIPL